MCHLCAKQNHTLPSANITKVVHPNTEKCPLGDAARAPPPTTRHPQSRRESDGAERKLAAARRVNEWKSRSRAAPKMGTSEVCVSRMTPRNRVQHILYAFDDIWSSCVGVCVYMWVLLCNYFAKTCSDTESMLHITCVVFGGEYLAARREDGFWLGFIVGRLIGCVHLCFAH